jgi:hypothetical protein
MEQAASFYGNLFSIQISMFGILVATVFVFVQLVVSSFSPEPLKFLFRNWWLRLYATSSIVSIGWTAIAYTSLSVGSHDFFPSVDFRSSQILTSPVTILLTLAFFFAPAVLFFFLVYSIVGLLQPREVMARLIDGIDLHDLRSYLHREFGIPEPPRPVTILLPVLEVILNEETASGNLNPDNELDGESARADAIANAEEKHRQDLAKYEERWLLYERAVREVRNSQDPYVASVELGIQAIRKADLVTFGITRLLLVQQAFLFFSTYEEHLEWHVDRILDLIISRRHFRSRTPGWRSQLTAAYRPPNWK